MMACMDYYIWVAATAAIAVIDTQMSFFDLVK